MKGTVAIAPVVVGAVVAMAIFFIGYVDARQPSGTDCFGVPACVAAQGSGFHFGYLIVAILVLSVSVAIGVAVERSDKRRPR